MIKDLTSFYTRYKTKKAVFASADLFAALLLVLLVFPPLGRLLLLLGLSDSPGIEGGIQGLDKLLKFHVLQEVTPHVTSKVVHSNSAVTITHLHGLKDVGPL